MQVLVVIEAADVQTRVYTRATHCILVFVAVYSGGIHFFRPIRIGHVELDARLIHTGPHSMRIAVHVRSGPVADLAGSTAATLCMSVFVDVGDPDPAAPAAA